jgi:hypothetical protein
MSDEVEMGRTDQKSRAQHKALAAAVAATPDLVTGAEKSLAKVTKNFKEQAKDLVAKAKSAFTQVEGLATQSRYSEITKVVQRFEKDNAGALAALQEQLKTKNGMTLSQVVLLVENVREIGRIASSV